MSKSRGEELLEALVNGETSDIKPQSRMEEYLLAAINKSGTEGLPKPISRGDALLYRLVDVISSGGGGDISKGFIIADGSSSGNYTLDSAVCYTGLPGINRLDTIINTYGLEAIVVKTNLGKNITITDNKMSGIDVEYNGQTARAYMGTSEGQINFGTTASIYCTEFYWTSSATCDDNVKNEIQKNLEEIFIPVN